MTTSYLSPDQIRDQFSAAMSAMYQAEVPQYATLLQLVREVNAETQPPTADARQNQRLSVERHGAIRLGTAAELATMSRVFAVMGMFPVGYYDLSTAGVPVHSTAFRPITPASLQINPFRIFTSLLRLELIDSDPLRQQVQAILAARDIFSPRLRVLLELQDRQGGLTAAQAQEFIHEALKTFRWHREAAVDMPTYQALLKQHRLVADVVCFHGPHINHLTPRTLDIDRVQQRMPDCGMFPKEVIEGPPRRRWPLLLRQTSFKALNEPISFTDGTPGMHTARFGEVEQRGMALTPTGRQLYDRLLLAASATSAGTDNASHQAHLQRIFVEFPDQLDEIRQQRLAYFRYSLVSPLCTSQALAAQSHDLDTLIQQGIVTVEPITYEDFLPVSAAGIFQSNLGSDSSRVSSGNPNQADFEAALGRCVINEFELYQQQEEASLADVMHKLHGGEC